MMVSTEVRLLAAETLISLEAALATAEQIAQRGIFESSSFEHLMTLLEDAASGADRIRLMVEGEDNLAVSSRGNSPALDRRLPQLIPGPSKPTRTAAIGPPDLRLVRIQENEYSAPAWPPKR